MSNFVQVQSRKILGPIGMDLDNSNLNHTCHFQAAEDHPQSQSLHFSLLQFGQAITPAAGWRDTMKKSGFADVNISQR